MLAVKIYDFSMLFTTMIFVFYYVPFAPLSAYKSNSEPAKSERCNERVSLVEGNGVEFKRQSMATKSLKQSKSKTHFSWKQKRKSLFFSLIFRIVIFLSFSSS